MSARANPTVIGVFVVAAAVIAAAGVIVLGAGTFFRDATRFQLFFDGDLSGLDEGAPVSFQGVTVGRVTDISIVYDHATDEISRPVEIEILNDAFVQRNIEQAGDPGSAMPKHIQRGLRARLDAQSLVTGKLKVTLAYFPDSEAVYRAPSQEVPEIPTVPAVLENLAERIRALPLEETIVDVREATRGIAALVQSGDLERTLEGLNDVMASIEAVMNAPELRAALVSLEGTLASVNEVVGSRAMQEVMASIDQTLKDTQATMQATQATMREVRRGADPLRREVMAALDGIVEATEVARSLLNYLERHPEALIRGKGKERP